jgi:hypothetical protein
MVGLRLANNSFIYRQGLLNDGLRATRITTDYWSSISSLNVVLSPVEDLHKLWVGDAEVIERLGDVNVLLSRLLHSEYILIN